jgi:hypothetical protein
MGQVREFTPKVQVGAHYDQNDEWARNPRLSGVIDLNERRYERDSLLVDRVLGALLWFALGYTVGFMVWG